MIFLGKELGKNKPPFIVAEISCNHEGNTEQAIKLIQAAHDSGADAVKIQVYTPEDMTLNVDVNVGDFRIKDGIWAGRDLYPLYSKTQTDMGLASVMFNYAKNNNIKLFASVFSPNRIAFLEDLGCPAYKIASFEITDLNLIRKVAKTGKSVVLSTGMATFEELDEATLCCNPDNSVVLHCISAYPVKLENANLWRIPWLKDLYPRFTVGFSDHTRGLTAGALACASGALVLEKHFALPGTCPEDAAFSLHPDEFKAYVQQCRIAAQAAAKTEVVEEHASRQFKRSLYAVKDIKEGEAFTPINIKAIRPSYGLPPRMYPRLISGMKANQDIKAGEALTRDMVI